MLITVNLISLNVYIFKMASESDKPLSLTFGYRANRLKTLLILPDFVEICCLSSLHNILQQKSGFGRNVKGASEGKQNKIKGKKRTKENTKRLNEHDLSRLTQSVCLTKSQIVTTLRKDFSHVLSLIKMTFNKNEISRSKNIAQTLHLSRRAFVLSLCKQSTTVRL